MLYIKQPLFAAYLHVIFVCCHNSDDARNDVWHYDAGLATISGTKLGIQAGQQDQSNFQEATMSYNVTRNEPNQMDQSLKNRAQSGESNATSGACNFQGRHLKVAVSLQPPFVDCLQNLYGDWLCNGSNIELVHVLERRFNFKSDWIVMASSHSDDHPVDMSRPWRRNDSSGEQLATVANEAQLAAVVGLVASGRAMMSANGFMRTIDRSARNLIVSEPFDTFRLHLLLSKSVRDHDHIFIKPFHPKAWLAIILSGAFVVPIFYFINTTSAYYVLEDDDLLRKVSLFDCLNYYKRTIISRFFVNPFRRTRSVSMTPSDLSLDREISAMLMIASSASRFNNNYNDTSFALTDRADRFAPGQATTFGFSLPIQFASSIGAQTNTLATNRRHRRLVRRQWAIDRMRARKLVRRKRRSGFFNVAYVIWYVVASLSNQGGETEDLPRANSTRILIAFWWLYLIVICAIHSGILTAILTFPRQHDFVDDYSNLKPNELANLHLSVDKHSELAHLLANSDNLHKSSLQLLKGHDVPVSYVNFQRNRQRILDKIHLGQTALIEEKSTIKQIVTREYYYSKRTKCLFKPSRLPIDVIPMSLLLSDRMPHNCVQLINETLARVLRSGLTRKWRRKFESAGNDCLNAVVINAGDVDKVEVKHVVLAFWLLAAGAGLGLLFLIAEVIWLFTIGDEDDDDDNGQDNQSGVSSATSALSLLSSSSSSGSLTSNESDDRVKLGFRRALMSPDYQLSAIRSLRARHLHVKTLLRKTKRNQKKRKTHGRHSQKTPRIIFTVDIDEDNYGDNDESDNRVSLDDSDGLKEVSEFHTRRLKERRNRRLARDAERRAKRIQRTVELVKRVHGGHIYSDRLKKRVRRLSNSLAGRFSQSTTTNSEHHNATTLRGVNGSTTVGRRKRTGSVHFGATNNRIMPVN